MKQVSAKHYYYIALHIITTQKQRYVPQLIVHVDIIRAKREFLQLMLLRTKISLPWATYIIISSVSGSETWPKQYINKQEKAVFFCTTSGIWHTSCMKSHFKEHFLFSWSNNTGLLSVFYDNNRVVVLLTQFTIKLMAAYKTTNYWAAKRYNKYSDRSRQPLIILPGYLFAKSWPE